MSLIPLVQISRATSVLPKKPDRRFYEILTSGLYFSADPLDHEVLYWQKMTGGGSGLQKYYNLVSLRRETQE